ncbi:Phosphoribosylformylglycinamidine synthase subunit PurL [Trichinella pseudospiralis]
MVIHLFALKCVCQGAVCEKRIRPSKEWIRMDGKFTLALSRQALVKALSTTGRGGKFPFLTNGSDHSQLRQRSIKRLCSSRMFSETGRLSVNFTSTQTIPEEQKMKKKKKEEKAPLLSSTNERSVFFVAQLSGEESFRRSVAKVKKGSPMTLGIGGIETKKKSRGQRFS